MTQDHPTAILGAGSFIADFLRAQCGPVGDPAGELAGEPAATIGFSRDVVPLESAPARIAHWVSLMPIVALPQRLPKIEAYRPERIVALSSTSIFTKVASPDPAEVALARGIADAERRLADWAERNGVAWTVLRPTLIYGAGRDRNVSEIARFIQKFGFFPLLGEASGLRQPVHAGDVAQACRQALAHAAAGGKAYNISGGETLSYRAMVERVFADLNRPVRLLHVPGWAFAGAIVCARLLPRFSDLSTALPRRMNQDMAFDHADAARDLDFRPRGFRLDPADIPRRGA
jgi:nucleoside-diphosphate-sugar epimerase